MRIFFVLLRRLNALLCFLKALERLLKDVRTPFLHYCAFCKAI